MDASMLVQLIGSLGFPIAACCALFWRMIKSDDEHKEVINKMSDALNNNTCAINKLADRIDKEGIKD